MRGHGGDLRTQADDLIEQRPAAPADDPYLAEPQCQGALAEAQLMADKVLVAKAAAERYDVRLG